MVLKGYQRVYLRGQAHGLKPVVQVGEKGVTESVAKAVTQALLDHELIKVKMSKPEHKKSMAQELADRTQSTLCGVVGHTAILYKAHPKAPRIHVPVRPESEDDDS